MLYSVHSLRLLAAVAVVCYHAGGWFGKQTVFVGAAGVDVFFVISGVVISLSTKPQETVADFCVKRLIRVFPLYWLATGAVLMLCYLEWGRDPGPIDLIHTLFLVPGPGWIPPYFPAWTLCFEMTFYCVFAVLLAVLRRDVTLVAAVVMAGLSAAHLPFLSAPGYSFPSDSCVEFAFGLALAAALKRGLKIDRMLGGTLLVTAIFLFVRNYDAQPNRVLGWGIPALMLVAGAISFEGSRIFRNRVLIFGGAASYSLYLFHATVIDLTIRVADAFDLSLKSHPAIAFVTFIVAPTIVAAAIHHFVEAPMLNCLRAAYRLASSFRRSSSRALRSVPADR